MRYVLLALVVAVTACVDTAGNNESGGALKAGAFDVCTRFVEDRLISPGSAEFPDFFDYDDEVSVTRAGDEFTVISHVDSENAFGASLQSDFSCVVEHVASTEEGNDYRLVTLDVAEPF